MVQNAHVNIIIRYQLWYNQAHTMRLTIREGAGYAGQDAFIKVEIDGVQKYYRNTGKVGLQHFSRIISSLQQCMILE